MRKARDAGDDLLLAYLTSLSNEEFRAIVDESPELSALFPASFRASELRGLGEREVDSFCILLSELASSATEAFSILLITAYLVGRAHRFTQADLSKIRTVIESEPKSPEPTLLLLACLEARHTSEHGLYERALEELDAGLGSLITYRDTPIGDYIRHLIYLRRADLTQLVGDFHAANNALERAQGIASRWGFRLQVAFCKTRLAELNWMAGEHGRALELHRDAEARSIAERAGQHAWLIRSHTSAAKCAIDGRKTEIAVQELAEARKLIELHPSAVGPNWGYYMLFSGQVDLQEARIEDAVEKYNEALRIFEKLDPPFHRGALEAKIALAEFALYEKKYRLFFALLEKLLDEAEQRNCIEARSRILLLQAYLFITEDPPLQAAFERSVERVHLINNPTLLLKALSFLFHYSVEHLGDRDQAFLLSRIRRIESLLDQSCYEGLYKTYVTDRYQSSVENRLARLLEREEGHLPTSEE